ncbi:MAG: GDSL-type esterase/lipase family protein [Gammaproteobacteria bacterium]
MRDTHDPKRRRLLAALSMSAGTLGGLALAEGIARTLTPGRVDSAGRMDPGLLRYDPRTGWALSANWSGRHLHHDYDVGYRTNASGWRFDPALGTGGAWRERVLWLGDSFTFGLGVGDSETFISQLNARDGNRHHLNRAVPGFSTDQEILLLEHAAHRDNADSVVLVIYLGNDPVDNLLTHPLQADNAKPRFILRDGEARPPDGPVPISRKVTTTENASLASWLLRDAPAAVPDSHRWLGQSALLRRLGWQPGWDEKVVSSVLERRRDEVMPLLAALIRYLDQLRRQYKQTLRIVLLPGRSLHTAPGGPGALSARFQRDIAQACHLVVDAMEIPLLDLTAAGALAPADYHPNDGHLTPRGHRVVAELLLHWLGRT